MKKLFNIDFNKVENKASELETKIERLTEVSDKLGELETSCSDVNYLIDAINGMADECDFDTNLDEIDVDVCSAQGDCEDAIHECNEEIERWNKLSDVVSDIDSLIANLEEAKKLATRIAAAADMDDCPKDLSEVSDACEQLMTFLDEALGRSAPVIPSHVVLETPMQTKVEEAINEVAANI